MASSTEQSHHATATSYDTPIYTLRSLEAEINNTAGCWDNYRYLPHASTVKFYTVPNDDKQHVLADALKKKTLVGTFTEDGSSSRSNVYAYVHAGRSNHGSAMNQVSFYINGRTTRLRVDEISNTQFIVPFKDACTSRKDESRARVRFLVLFYFLEKNYLDKLVSFKDGLQGFIKTCEKVAQSSRDAEKQPVRGAYNERSDEAKRPCYTANKETSTLIATTQRTMPNPTFNPTAINIPPIPNTGSVTDSVTKTRGSALLNGSVGSHYPELKRKWGGDDDAAQKDTIQEVQETVDGFSQYQKLVKHIRKMSDAENEKSKLQAMDFEDEITILKIRITELESEKGDIQQMSDKQKGWSDWWRKKYNFASAESKQWKDKFENETAATKRVNLDVQKLHEEIEELRSFKQAVIGVTSKFQDGGK